MRKKWLAGALALLISMQGILPCTVFAELDEDGIISIEEEALPDEELSQAGETMLTEEEDFLEITEEDTDIVEAGTDFSLEEEITEILDEEPADTDTPAETDAEAELQESPAAETVDSITEEVPADEEMLDVPEEADEDEDEEADPSMDEARQEIMDALHSPFTGGDTVGDVTIPDEIRGFLDNGADSNSGEPEMVGVNSLTTQSHSTLKNYLMNHGTYSSSNMEYYISNRYTENGTVIFWSVSYSPSKDKFTFLMSGTTSDQSVEFIIGMDVLYLFRSNPHIVYGEYVNDTNVSLADYTVTNRAGYNGNQTVGFTVHKADGSTTADVRNRANDFLSNAYKLWDSLISSSAGITMRDFGFGRSDTVDLKPPVLIAAYNGAKGIGIKFNKAANATEYVIYRKYNNVWSRIRTISANASELQFSGNTIMYTDTTVAKNYGKGYIYSVASKNGNQETSYDKVGKAIYRLTPPTLTSAVYNGNGTVTVSWKAVFGRTETNGNYDLQAAVYKNGKTGTFKSLVGLPGFKYNIVRALVTDCKAGTYVFRIRCSKTNKDRGTFYSEYSPWRSVNVW